MVVHLKAVLGVTHYKESDDLFIKYHLVTFINLRLKPNICIQPKAPIENEHEELLLCLQIVEDKVLN